MKEYVLSYYPKFKCIADKCKHTCCAGWDMIIDNCTLNQYKKDASNFSNTLKSGIDFKRSKFKSNKNKRCAFLNDNNLCDIILNLGENSLCQICKDHPRFRSRYGNVLETGIGFCCEEGAKLILSTEDKIELTLINDDDSDLSFIEDCILKFRDKAVNIIQDRNIDINDRILSLLDLCSVKGDVDFSKILKTFNSLERLNKSWSIRLKKLKGKDVSTKTGDNLALYCEQFLVNSLYRHIITAEDVIDARARAIFCVISWWIINAVYQCEREKEVDFELICDIVREFSCEVEYSQKNLIKAFAFAYKFIGD